MSYHHQGRAYDVSAAVAQLAPAMRRFSEALARLSIPLRRLGLHMARQRHAPRHLGCDGTVVAIDWPRAYAWCRCRRRWSFEEIVRG